MTTIKLNNYYPHLTECVTLEVSEEIAVTLSIGGRMCDSYKRRKDKGFSGKNTDRPRFQELMADIKRGLIRRVVVYKLDRISRSILDFATMMELFQQYNVEFVSSTEKFDTSSPFISLSSRTPNG